MMLGRLWGACSDVGIRTERSDRQTSRTTSSGRRHFTALGVDHDVVTSLSAVNM